MRLKPESHFREVDGAMAFVDLHGVPATERNLCSAFALEIGKLVSAASCAIGSRMSGCDFSAVIAPKIE
jgi:hypothetical protein